ncbi:MAG: RsmF rRNA methyltransferase first C-terminal domain-containing protein [Clostridia bacterium]|nr:RsmF rRNA methyltransferase first C-terminal domain-containing protein [Clostridia bacterium]
MEMCARRQAEILHSAARMVRPGGRLVYSTCTFAPAENEEAIAAFLESHPDFVAEAVTAPWFVPGENGSFRMWPHKLLGEGHFAAVLRRLGDEERNEPEPQPGVPLPREWESFAKELDICLPKGVAVQFGQSLYLAPEGLPLLRGLKVERPGLELGELKKNRFEPAHALALWLRGCRQTKELGDLTEAYMAGAVIPAACRGWTLMTVDGYSIGWGKGDGSVLKNHYPKGLRRAK